MGFGVFLPLSAGCFFAASLPGGVFSPAVFLNSFFRFRDAIFSLSAWFETLTTRNSLLERCLAQATAVCRQTFGDNPGDWQWGQLHQVSFQHALGQITPFDHIFNVGPLPLGGDANTVAQAGMRLGSFASDGISVSSRLIVDMSAIHQGEAMLAPGQSGHLGSPHYDDLVKMWKRGEYFPVLWHEDDVAAATVHNLTLTKRP